MANRHSPLAHAGDRSSQGATQTWPSVRQGALTIRGDGLAVGCSRFASGGMTSALTSTGKLVANRHSPLGSTKSAGGLGGCGCTAARGRATCSWRRWGGEVDGELVRAGTAVVTVGALACSMTICAPSAVGDWQRGQNPSEGAATIGAVAEFRVCARAFGSHFRVGHGRFSAPTALADLKCSRHPSRKAIKERAFADIGAGRAKGIEFLTRSFRRSDRSVHVRSISTIDKATFKGFGFGAHEYDTLVIKGISSRVHVWHDAAGFHHRASATFADFTLEGQPLEPVDDVIVIPGIARIGSPLAPDRMTRMATSNE